MELLNLPDDILQEIIQACDRVSLFALLLTSLQINALCSPHLLHDVYLDRDWSRITSFLAYIINHTHSVVETGVAEGAVIRGPGTHVRMFAITYSAVVPTTLRELAGDLSKALGLMPNLRSWKTTRFRPLLAASPILANVLMSLPNLRHIQLVDIDKAAGKKLSTALIARSKGSQAPMHLESIKVELVRGAPLISLADCGIGELLLYNNSSLKRISLINCDLVEFLSHPRAVFPSVISLSLTTYRGTLDTLAQSFPHVQNINFANPMNQADENKTLAYSARAVSSAPRPVPFTHLLSVQGDQWETTPLIKYLGSSRAHLRRIVLTQRALAGRQKSRTVPQDSPQLKSLHLGSIYLWPDNEWRDLVNRMPRLSFLKFTVSQDVAEEGSQFVSTNESPHILANNASLFS